MSIRTIVVATDFSADADRALEWAIQLARPSAARLHLLHSSELAPVFGRFPEALGVSPEFTAELRAQVSARLEELAKRVTQAGLECTRQVSEEPPVAAIVSCATAVAADLVAMGTRGRTGLPHALLGSIAERTVRLAPCPVLTVKADPSDPGVRADR